MRHDSSPWTSEPYRPRRTGTPGSNRREHGWALRPTAGHTENRSQTTLGKRPEMLEAASRSQADEPDRELGPGEFRRDGRILSAPDYGADDPDADQRDDVVEGELAPPATMIGHETVAIEEPEPAVVEAIEPVPPPPAPESAAARYERERVAGWVRARLTPYPMDRCCYCRLPFNVGQPWQDV